MTEPLMVTIEKPATPVAFDVPLELAMPMNVPMDIETEHVADEPTLSDIQQAIADAAAQTNTEPSDAQKDAGNFKKGRFQLHGLQLVLENPQCSIRSGVDQSGRPWETIMPHHYGYILRTESEADGQQVDAYIGPNPENDRVHIVDQLKPNGAFDEHKVMLGWDSTDEARDAYNAAYGPNWAQCGGVTEMTLDELKDWLANGDTTQTAAYHKSRSANQ